MTLPFFGNFRLLSFALTAENSVTAVRDELVAPSCAAPARSDPQGAVGAFLDPDEEDSRWLHRSTTVIITHGRVAEPPQTIRPGVVTLRGWPQIDVPKEPPPCSLADTPYPASTGLARSILRLGKIADELVVQPLFV